MTYEFEEPLGSLPDGGEHDRPGNNDDNHGRPSRQSSHERRSLLNSTRGSVSRDTSIPARQLQANGWQNNDDDHDANVDDDHDNHDFSKFNHDANVDDDHDLNSPYYYDDVAESKAYESNETAKRKVRVAIRLVAGSLQSSVASRHEQRDP